MRASPTAIWLLLLLLLAAPATPPVLAQAAAPAAATEGAADAELSDLRVRLEGAVVKVSLTLTGNLGRRFEERLKSGLPTTVVYHFELHRDRKRWWDQRLRDGELEVAAIYDAVDRSYNVHFRLDDKLIESRTVRDRPSLDSAMRRIENLPVFDVGGLPHDWRLLVKAQAELGSRTLLSFIPVTIETDWADSAKFRAPAPP
jgi:hypothetical protein